MRNDFSAHFLRVISPDTNFGEAWESLCEILLSEEFGTENIMRLRPPDRGVDLLYRPEKKAFQCKSNEQGGLGTINPEESIKSLETAIKHRHAIEWIKYCFAINTEFTGAGYEKIIIRAKQAGLNSDDIEILGPAYWDKLCSLHFDAVQDRFDYRVSISEKLLLDGLQNSSVSLNSQDFATMKDKPESTITITNNLTPLEIEVPLLENLSVEELERIFRYFLGVDDTWTSLPDIEMSAKPVFSLRFRDKELDFFVRLKSLNIEPDEKLELHIDFNTIERRILGVSEKDAYARLGIIAPNRILSLPIDTNQFKRKLAISYMQELFQAIIWMKAKHLLISNNIYMTKSAA